MEKQYIGAYLQYYRKSKGMTQSELAQGFCVRQTLSKIEKGLDSVPLKEFLALLDHLQLTYLDIDRTIIYRSIETFYLAYLHDQDLVPYFQEIYSNLNTQDILHQEYYQVFQILYTHYIEHKHIPPNTLTQLLSQRNMYPIHLQYMISHMVYQIQSLYLSDRKLEKYINNNSLFTSQEPLSIRSEITLLISLKRYLEAYELTQELYITSQKYSCYTLQLEALRYVLLLYERIQSVFSYKPIHKIEEFLHLYSTNLKSKQVCDTYYQMATILLRNHYYSQAYTYFTNCHELFPNLLSAVVFMNYIALHRSTDLPFITMPIHTLKTNSIYTTIYQYFAYKHRLISAKVNDLLLYNGLETYLITHILDIYIQDHLLHSIMQEEIRVVYHHTKNSRLLPVLG